MKKYFNQPIRKQGWRGKIIKKSHYLIGRTCQIGYENNHHKNNRLDRTVNLYKRGN